MSIICHRAHRGRSILLVLFFSVISVASSACSMPSLEKPECTVARDAVKRFYSFHFGNDMHPSQENLRARQGFLTSELFSTLSASGDSARDYFTATDNYPKAFRVGACTSDTENKVVFQILLLWRDEQKSEQKEVHVETVKTGDTWLINKVSN